MFAQARDVGYIHTPDEGDEVHGVYAHARVGGLNVPVHFCDTYV